MKTLVINNVVYAKYETDGNHLYLKMLVKFFEDDENESEFALMMIIQLIEKTKFDRLSYLNV